MPGMFQNLPLPRTSETDVTTGKKTPADGVATRLVPAF